MFGTGHEKTLELHPPCLIADEREMGYGELICIYADPCGPIRSRGAAKVNPIMQSYWFSILLG